MNLLTFETISLSKYLVYFTSRTYSLELLFILENHKEFEGIENLYQTIFSPKPKYPAFKTYLYFLKDKGCIRIKNGANKKSAKILELNSNVLNEFYKILK